MKRRVIAVIACPALVLWLAGCATTVPQPILRVNANVSSEVPDFAARTYFLEVPSAEVLALIQPHHESLRAILTAHGYEEVPQSQASFVVAVNAFEGVRTAPPGTTFGPRRSAADASPNKRFTRADAILPNRNQEFLTEDMNGPPNFTIGPEGKIIATGLARTVDEASAGFAEPAPEIQYRYVTMLSLHMFDATAVPTTGGLPRWQVVVVGESFEEAAPLPLGTLIELAGDYVETSSEGETIVELASTPVPGETDRD